MNLAKGFRGGERQTALLIRHLSKFKIGQYLVCRRDSPLIGEVKGIANLEVRPVSGRLAGHWRPPPWTIAHAHESKAAHWAFLSWLRHGRPYLITRRNVFVPKRSFLTRNVYRRASRVVAISASVSKTLSTYDASLPLEIIGSASATLPVDPREVAKLRQSFGNRKVIGHVGALVDSHKGQKTLLQVAQHLNTARPDLVFVFAGKGQDEQEFKALSEDLSNVVWLGFRDDVANVIAAFDVFAFPSRLEALGSTLLDVMEIGVPIAASNVDGIPELIKDGETGLLVKPGDADALGKAILRLLSDPSLADTLTANAAAYCQHYAPEVMAEKYQAVYRSIENRASDGSN